MENKSNTAMVHIYFNARDLRILREVAIIKDVPIARLVKDVVLTDLYDKIEKLEKTQSTLDNLYNEINTKNEKLQKWYNGIDEKTISKKIFLNGSGSSE